MPYDGTNYGRKNLSRLAEALRDRSQWPPDFRWNYARFRGCAVGLADRLGIDHRAGLTPREHADVFLFCGGPFGMLLFPLIRPEHVAAKLERILARHAEDAVKERTKRWL